MKTAFVLKAHVEDDGRVVSDERVPLPPGPVVMTVQEVSRGRAVKTGGHKARAAKMKAMLKKIQAIKCPPVPQDGKTIDEILYGE